MAQGQEHSEQTPPSASAETISQCLRMVMGLSAHDLSQPSNQAALRALRDTINSLLKMQTESAETRREMPDSDDTDAPLRTSRIFSFKEESMDETPATDSTASENRLWRSRRKSTQEKDEKRARLEKREEILRNLRNAVSEFKAEKTDDHPLSSPSNRAKSEENPLDKFEMRRQRASFWPQGSKEWARQLLCVELGMDASERRQCYIDMVKACHPDHNQNIAPDAIQLVNAAWDILR